MADTNSQTSDDLNTDEFLELLGKIIGNVKDLQNSPPHHVPQESLTADLVVEYLKPVTQPAGPLIVRKIEYVEGRGNLIIELPAAQETTKCVSFVGMHMDVVPANPEDWDKDPFSLTIEGDKIFGRGVTDCSGHVALVAQVMKRLAESGVKLKRNVYCVCIANEENSSVVGVGIDELAKHGELDKLKDGPLYWVDSANFGPTLGTAGMHPWELHVVGKKGHSGMPQNGINALECATQIVQYMQRKFYEKFPAHELEAQYKFITSSSFKPTQISIPPGSVNQIPGECTVKGDVRFLPFYTHREITEYMCGLAENLDLAEIETFGASRYSLPDGQTAKVSFKFFNEAFIGVACDMNSVGCKVLCDAIDKFHEGGSKPFSLTGSLPIIASLRENGFDTQCVGFGRMEAYHAANEYASIAEFGEGYKICMEVITNLSETE